MMIDIICPYCYDKITAEFISEKRITYKSADGITTLIREYHGWCDECKVGITLEVGARLEDD